MRERDLFIEALQADSPAARTAYLEAACAGDADLRRRVERLLEEHARQESFILDAPPPGIAATGVSSADFEQAGRQIGPYLLLQQIGEGGMGVVFMAEQTEPVERRVAIKIVKLGMDSRSVMARFEAERHALGVMDHPNIAHVLDAGTTSSGRPYFVMELIRGVPITKYSDDHRLTPRERLELFIPVCEAVQHAHQKGIIHRDLKPSNVLVAQYDGRPVPKVIDFGVAKATGPKLTEQTLFTEFGSIVGTLEYMSPEQAKMDQLDIDTRSDVYSLGVLLYELLTGTTPLERGEIKGAAVLELLRIIREDEPPKPSARLSTTEELPSIAAQRGLEPKKLSGLVRGELDWIVMKCLEKERSRRYETANGLASDLKRYLADEPVLACPPSAVYRFRKFARRNKSVLGTAVVITAALLLGTATSTWYALQAREARRLAERRLQAEEQALRESTANLERARAAVDEYFTLVSESKLLDVPGLQPLRKDLLEAALRYYETIAAERTDDPAALADLAVTHLRVGEVYLAIDRTDDCLHSLSQALDLIDRLRRDFPADMQDQRRLAGYWKGSRSAQKRGPAAPRDPQGAMQTLVRLTETWESLTAAHPSEVAFQSDMASIYAHMGIALDFPKPGEAVVYFEKAQRILQSLVSQFPQKAEYRADLARVHENLSGTYLRLGRRNDSLAATQRSLELCEQLAADFPDVPQYQVDLTINLLTLARKKDAEQPIPIFRRAIDLLKGLAAEYPGTPLYHSLLTGIVGDLQALAGRAGESQQEAERLYRELLADVTGIAEEHPEHSDPHWRQATASNNFELAKLLEKGGQPQEAERSYRQSVAILEKLATESPDVPQHGTDLAAAQIGLADLLAGPLKRPDDAMQVYRQAEAVLQAIVDENPEAFTIRHELGRVHNHLGLLFANTDRFQDAEQSHQKALNVYRDLTSTVSAPQNRWHRQELMWTHENFARLFTKWERPVDAEQAWRESIAVASQLNNEFRDQYNGWLANQRSHLAALLLTVGRRDEAEELLSKQTPEDLNGTAWRLAADANPDNRNPTLAVELAKLAVARAPDQGYMVNTLGTAYYRAGEWTKAIDALQDADDLYQGQFFSSDGFFIAMSHWRLGDKETALKWYAAASQWMDRFAADDDEQRRFRTEAATLLGLTEAGSEAPPELLDDRELFTLILDAWPEAAWACLRRAQAYESAEEVELAQADYFRAVELYDSAVERKPDSAQPWAQRGFALSQLDEWDKAVSDLDHAIALGAGPAIWYLPALVRLGKQDMAGYRLACARILDRLVKSPASSVEPLALWACAVGPDAAAELAPVITLAEQAAQKDPNSLQAVNTLGALLYRAGRFDEAARSLERADVLAQNPGANSSPAYAWFFLAMTHHRLGHPDAAASWLAKATVAAGEALQDHAAGKSTLPWNRRLTLSLLRNEAETLLGAEQTPVPQSG
ncbi:MAG: protein kinase, partial [Planctomycetaceae bacterium]